MEEAAPTLLEPIMNVEIAAPEQYMGDLMGDPQFAARTGAGHERPGIDAGDQGAGADGRDAHYASTLKSITGGRGSYRMSFAHYEEVPAHLQAKIVAAHKVAKEGTGAAASH